MNAAITPQWKLESWLSWYRSTRSRTRNVQIVITQFRIFAALGLFSWSGSHFIGARQCSGV